MGVRAHNWESNWAHLQTQEQVGIYGQAAVWGRQWMELRGDIKGGGCSGYTDLTGSLLQAANGNQMSPGREAFAQMSKVRDSLSMNLAGFLLKLGSVGPERMGPEGKVESKRGQEEPDQSDGEKAFGIPHCPHP